MALNSGLPADEAALIRAAQAGDQDAFAQLVYAYDQSVLRLAMNLLRSPEDARDVYQEAFLRVFRNLNNFRFDCSFHTWLYRIVTNLCLDQMRKRKVRREEPTVLTARRRTAGPDGFGAGGAGGRRSAAAPVQRPVARTHQAGAGRHDRRASAWSSSCAITRDCGCGASAKFWEPPRKRPRTACSGRRRKCAPRLEILYE